MNNPEEAKKAWDASCPKCGNQTLVPINEITFKIGYEGESSSSVVDIPFKGIGCKTCMTKFIDADAHEYMMSHILRHQETSAVQPKNTAH